MFYVLNLQFIQVKHIFILSLVCGFYVFEHVQAWKKQT